MNIYHRTATMLLLGITILGGCTPILDMDYMSIKTTKQQPSYEEFTRNRKECKKLAENFCPYPLKGYCMLDAYEKQIVFIKNCMHERGWNDPYNMFSYYK